MSVPPPHAESPSDSDLVGLAARGDTRAFETLYLRHREFVYRVARRHADPEGALDASQEAFLYLLKKIPTLRLSGRLTTYLYPIVKNIALTHRRTAARRLDILGERSASTPAPESTPLRPSGATADHELADALAALPDEQREVLLMRIADEMTVQEVGVALGIPDGTVKSRLHHALAALRADPRLAHLHGTGG